MNYFDSPEAATLYARGRVYYHEHVTRHIAARLGRQEPWQNALDVCCGTGLSTQALLPLTKRIVGVDASPAMLALAPQDERITYYLAPAETMPLPDATFDLVTLCQAFHWLEQERFLREVARVMRPGGFFVVYEDGVRGELREEPGFTQWFQTDFQPRFPYPERNPRFATENGAPDGFILMEYGTTELWYPLVAAQLADFFLSMSNLLMWRHDTGTPADVLHAQIVEQLLPFFDDNRATVRHLRFGCPYWILGSNKESR